LAVVLNKTQRYQLNGILINFICAIFIVIKI
jgi:hypothetical protein